MIFVLIAVCSYVTAAGSEDPNGAAGQQGQFLLHLLGTEVIKGYFQLLRCSFRGSMTPAQC